MIPDIVSRTVQPLDESTVNFAVGLELIQPFLSRHFAWKDSSPQDELDLLKVEAILQPLGFVKLLVSNDAEMVMHFHVLSNGGVYALIGDALQESHYTNSAG